MTDIVERLRKPSGIGEPMDHMAMEEAADDIERLRTALRGAATVVRASADEIERLRAPALPSDRLIDALAECIVARQGLPNRDRARMVLTEIEAQGWQLVPPKEARHE